MQKILKLKIKKTPILNYILKYIHLNKYGLLERTDSLINPNINNRSDKKGEWFGRCAEKHAAG